jgi:hypothetical protein
MDALLVRLVIKMRIADENVVQKTGHKSHRGQNLQPRSVKAIANNYDSRALLGATKRLESRSLSLEAAISGELRRATDATAGAAPVGPSTTRRLAGTDKMTYAAAGFEAAFFAIDFDAAALIARPQEGAVSNASCDFCDNGTPLYRLSPRFGRDADGDPHSSGRRARSRTRYADDHPLCHAR